MSLCTLAASRNMLAGKSKKPGRGLTRAGEGVTWVGQGSIATSHGQCIIRAGQDF